MHAFWAREGDSTALDVRDDLARSGLDRAYTTVATLVKILVDKGYLAQTNAERPHRYRPSKSFEEVSGRLLAEVVERVFLGSRGQLLVRLIESGRLTDEERAALEAVLRESGR